MFISLCEWFFNFFLIVFFPLEKKGSGESGGSGGSGESRESGGSGESGETGGSTLELSFNLGGSVGLGKYTLKDP